MPSRPARLLVIGDIAWDILVRPERELVWGSDVVKQGAALAAGNALGAHVACHVGAQPERAPRVSIS
jgi:hypothetical protein